MNISIVTKSKRSGGANLAAVRLFDALQANGTTVDLITRDVSLSKETVSSLPGLFMNSCIAKIRSAFGVGISKFVGHQEFVSANLLPSNLATAVFNRSYDVVNIHWIGGEAWSIADVANLESPLVWTLHDQWPLQGIYHYSDIGYREKNKHRTYKSNIIKALDDYVQAQKKKYWKRRFHYVAPSRWMADCAHASKIGGDKSIHVIPNPVDTNRFAPADQIDSKLFKSYHIMFGAEDISNHRKGFDLFLKIMQILDNNDIMKRCHIDIFGNYLQCSNAKKYNKISTAFQGHIEQSRLATLLSTADLLVLTSRIDNLPQVATEAICSHCPVVAFDIGGIRDIVDDGVTGYLVPPFDCHKFAAAVIRALELKFRFRGTAAFEKKRKLWSNQNVSSLYSRLFERIASKAQCDQ